LRSVDVGIEMRGKGMMVVLLIRLTALMIVMRMRVIRMRGGHLMRLVKVVSVGNELA
jgi:hypothetical protein